MYYTCPVCGYMYLREAPYARSGIGSFDICPSCGFQFGVSDLDEGFTHEAWRKEWIAKNMPWSSIGIQKPTDWNPEQQYKKLLGEN